MSWKFAFFAVVGLLVASAAAYYVAGPALVPLGTVEEDGGATSSGGGGALNPEHYGYQFEKKGALQAGYRVYYPVTVEQPASVLWSFYHDDESASSVYFTTLEEAKNFHAGRDDFRYYDEASHERIKYASGSYEARPGKYAVAFECENPYDPCPWRLEVMVYG